MRSPRGLCVQLLLLTLAGCGGGSDGPGTELIGNWEYLSGDGSTGALVQFRGDGTYQDDTLYFTSATTANDQRESGTYAATSDTVTLTPQESTCATPSSGTLNWSRSGNHLSLSVAQGEVVFTAFMPSSQAGTAVFNFGCNVNGTWVPAQ